MVIAFVSQKGGVGKSTLAIGTSACLSGKLVRAALVDADPQRTVSDWARCRDEPAFPITAAADSRKLPSQVQALAAEHDHVVIDAPPHSAAHSRAAIIAADLVLVPAEPSAASDWAIETTLDQVREAQELRPEIQVAIVLNRVQPRTVLARSIRQRLARLDGAPVLATELAARIAHAEALSMGRTIFEWAPRSKAAAEIAALVKEVLKKHATKEKRQDA